MHRLALSLALLLPGSVFAQNLRDGLEDDLTHELVVSGLDNPVGADFLPDGRMLIIEQGNGRVRLFDGAGDATTVGQIAVQAGGERGLLGIAVDPMFATSRRVYLYRSTDGAQQVGYALFENGVLDVDNFTPLLSGMAANRNHNGGGIAFGPDGHLYIGVGDTGCNCGCGPADDDDIPPTGGPDPSRNYFGTCLTNLHGKILRIDRDGNVPDTNPLVNETEVAACAASTNCRAARTFPTETAAPRTEIYNWGFRNPWRFSFDEQTGHMWIGDVGEISFEEITISTGPGQHHGWPLREGQSGVDVDRCAFVTPQSGDCREPALQYPRNEPPNTNAASITAGVFSNDCVWPAEYNGLYWFGDYVKARIWTVIPNQDRDGIDGDRTIVVENTRGLVHMFGGPDGGIYYINTNVGTIWRIGPATPACERDGGVAVPDAGDAPDAGAAPDADPVDTGTPDTGSVDAGTPEDGGTSPVPDAGTPDDSDPNDEGCGCRTTHTAPIGLAGWALSIVAFSYIRRRRRR